MKWAFEVILFTTGIGVGFLIHYWGWNKSSEIKRLMRDFNQLNREHRELQTSIDDYFNKTNQLIINLNSTYDSLQEHFHTGIETLGKRANLQNKLNAEERANTHYDKAAIPKSLFSTQNLTHPQDSTKTNASFNAPKDYAPKEESDKGTLAEDFGLKNT